jgi:tetratricopeptide (TPR) repeat protein
MSHEITKYTSSALQAIGNNIALTKKMLSISEAERYYNLSIDYREKEEYSNAKYYVLKALEFHPNFYNAHLELIALCLDLSENENAIIYTEHALKQFPEDASLYMARGKLKAELYGKYQEAIDDFTIAIELERKLSKKTRTFHEAFLERANSKGQIGDDEGRVRDTIVYKLRRHLYERNNPNG